MPRLVDNPAAPPAGTGSRLRTNGFSIDVRDLRPHDSAVLDDLFARMSLQSRYLLFHAAVISLSETARASLLDVHERDHIALVLNFPSAEPFAEARRNNSVNRWRAAPCRN